MPNGYLVTLGDATLGAGDSITDPLVSFTTAVSIGAGQWTWSGRVLRGNAREGLFMILAHHFLPRVPCN